MCNRFALLVLPLLAVALFAGCQSADPTPPEGQSFRGAQAVRILHQVHGDDAGLSEPGVTLIRDAGALRRLDAESLNNLDVNFSEHDVIIVALGEQPTGGYWAHVTGVQQVGDVLYVQGMANQPGEDDAATQALTHPFAAVVIPKTEANLALSDIESVRGESLPE